VTRARVQLVPVPGETCLAFTAERGFHLLAPAPAWWWEEQEQRLVEDEERLARPALALVPPLSSPRTSCRPGRGPCGRRHAHASERRAS